MAIYAFNRLGRGGRTQVANAAGSNGNAVTTDYNWQVPANSVIGRHVVYNEADSTVYLDFSLNSGFTATVNSNAGRDIEILDGRIRILAGCSGIVSVHRAASTAAAVTAATSSGSSAEADAGVRSSHRTSTAHSGRRSATGQELGERVVVQAILEN